MHIRRTQPLVSIALTTALIASAAAFGQLSGKGKPKARVTLVPSVESVVPGVPFDAALHFVIEDEWHIYWENSGDSGMPPRVKWALPPGFSAGGFRFPVPKRHYDPGPIVTNILDGEPSLLVQINLPKQISADQVTISADVQYLSCAGSCIRETAKVSMTLPISDPGTSVEKANEDLFRRARAALPKSSSPSVTISTSSKPPELSPGDKFEYAVTVKIADGHVIPAPNPGAGDPFGVDLFAAGVPGLFYDETKYPKPQALGLGPHGSVQVYKDSFTVRISGEVDAAASGPFNLGGVLVFQPCEVAGNCLPIQALAFPSGGAAARTATTTGASAGATDPSTGTGSAAAGEGGGIDGALRRFGLVGLLIGCFIYGLFINATPCVLPLLSIKVLGFVQQAHQSRGRTLALGLSFGVGVMVFFVVLGFLAAQGTNVLQFPGAIIGLGAVVLALGLSMLGVYTLQVPTAATKLEASLQKEGLATSFGKGALAPVLGFACTGPLLAGAFGWATQQPAHIAFFAFLAAGLGMAFPYMLLGANPHWLSFLPKPGNWMITFERIMGFLLLGMVIWLVHPLSNRIGVAGLEWTLVFYVAVAMGCWVFGQIDLSMSAVRRWSYRGAAVAVIVLVGGLIYEVIYPLDEARAAAAQEHRAEPTVVADAVGPYCPIPWQLWDAQTAASTVCEANAESIDFKQAYQEVCRANFEASWKERIPWHPWSPNEVERAVEAGWIAFVDFTADTCTVCKSNKLVAINTDEVRRRMKELGVVPFQGDYSTGDKEIFAMLQKFERPGVPLNLVYPAYRPDQPIVLRTNLSKDYLLQKLEEAAAAGPTDLADSSQATLRAAQPGLP